jgi:RNA polymerase sigma-70 factor (ECF subfamily)
MWSSAAVDSRVYPNPRRESVLPRRRQKAAPSQPSEWNETQLIEELLSDNPLAWREFNTRYARLIMSCINRVLARFSRMLRPDDAQEIYATLCVQLLANDKHKLRSFEPSRGNKLGTWLGMLASHSAYDFLRSVRREPKHGAFSEAEELRSAQPDPCEVTLMRERARLVHDLLRDFSAKDRAFIALYFGDGLSPEQVADRLSISVKTVYSKKHKIQRRLEALLSAAQLAA